MLLRRIKNILRHKRYKVYSRPYELNIVGIRSENTVANRFDDEFHVFFKTENGGWQYHVFKGTTDPGTYYLEHPLQEQGAAILAEGQYIGVYQLGLHRGQYKALVQRGTLTIMRDYDRNAILDFRGRKEKTNDAGINIHHASSNGITKSVDQWSAGCQVFANISDFNFFITLCERHEKLYGNKFTYTLIDFREIRRAKLRMLVEILGALGLGGAAATAIYLYQRFKTETKNKEHDSSTIAF